MTQDMMATDRAAVLAQKLAVQTAIEKVVKAAKAETRAELANLMGREYLASGIQGRDIKIGPEKVGKVSVSTRADPDVTDLGAWRWFLDERGKLKRWFTIDSRQMDPKDRELLKRWCRAHNVSPEEHVEEVDPLEGLSERPDGSLVETATGEVVPGIHMGIPKTGIRVTGCTPQKVGPALQATGADMSVSLLLEGEGL